MLVWSLLLVESLRSCSFDVLTGDEAPFTLQGLLLNSVSCRCSALQWVRSGMLGLGTWLVPVSLVLQAAGGSGEWAPPNY